MEPSSPPDEPDGVAPDRDALAQERTRLALERTRLANERTLLAYARTALALLAAGAVLPQFFPAHPGLVRVAWGVAAAGAATGAAGLLRFLTVRRRLGRGD